MSVRATQPPYAGRLHGWRDPPSDQRHASKRAAVVFTRQGQQAAAVVGFGGDPSEGCDATCSILERPATGLSDPDAGRSTGQP
jgi:hypothetical protein